MTMTMRWIYFVLVFVPVHSLFSNSSKKAENLISTPCTDKNHFFLAPGVLTAGGTNRACISRFHPEGPARMVLSLISEDNQTVTASRELPAGDGGCLDISVPLLPNTKADLVVNIWYPQASCAWERRVTLRISSGRVVAVHTERARYRPGETLRARVFALKADFTPASGNVEEIWIEGPPGAWEGTRVAQWSKVRSKMGLAQIQHDIDELAPPGRWTVRARLGDGSQGSAVFWVGSYELPPFQLTVRHAARVLRTSERLVWTVCVRYPWTEAVEGMLVIRLRGAGSDSSGIRTAVRLRAPRACHRHAAAARRVGLGGEHPPDVVVADFSFQEEGTRVWQNTTVVSQVVDKPISLEFVTKHRTVISPGLPYKLKIKATRWDDKPASNERVRVCRYSTATDKPADTDSPACISGDTDDGGVARVMFAAEDDGSPYYRFEASLYNDSSTTTGLLTLATRRSPIQVALGPLRADSKGARTFVPLYLSLQNVTNPVTVHFVVITRGGIIYRWGATTQCPISSAATHIQTATRNSKCNDPMAQYDDNNNIHDNNNHQDDKNSINYNIHDNNNRQDDKNNNNKNINDDNNHRDDNNNKNGYNNKSSRSYDVNINLYINQKQNINIHNYLNKTNSYLTRNMNQNDKNNYLHKNDDKNHTIYDRFNPVVITNILDKTHDVNSIKYEANASDSLLDRYLLRVMLPIKVTQQMCPDSHLIAYFYYNGEFVSASKHFEMDDCFVNKVEASFLSRQALPGSLTTLQVSTPGPALCALTALDSAAKWSATSAVRDVLVRGLRRMIDGHRNVTEYDAARDCFLSGEVPQPLPSGRELTAAWLAAAGVRTLGDVPLLRSCDALAALIDEGTVPRSDFSEAWLWRLVTVGGNGSALTTARAPDSITRYEASAVCLSKTGIAVSQPAVLQVFREFFIHADSPKRLRRGDTTIIRYRLFNYLYEPLSVQIQILTGPGLQGPAELVESLCVPPRASSARRASITATSAGEGRVMIRAKAVNDGGCGNTSYMRGVSDEVIMKIVVDPEGIPIQEQKSMLLCGKEKSNSTSSQVSWTFSQAAMIPGTETLTVWAAGDIVGPLLADADSLVLLPRGCGEQNMARLATNLVALQHLHPHSAAALQATEHVARGLTRQLQYVHPSGGFSAFGAADATSSTWLTAFSLRYLRRAHQVLMPNQPVPPAVEKAERWLLNQQMENGCFRNEGQVFHKELRGGLNEDGEIASVALTAYVITSLLESTSPIPSRVLRNTLSCLRALPSLKYNPPARVYAHSLLAYAFIRLKKYEEDLRMTNEAKYEDLRTSRSKSSSEAGRLQRSGLKEHEGLLEVMELVKMATRDGEYLWWETGNLATSIEATSYALLALRSSPSALQEFGAGAVRWLAAHRGPSGGFVSTQDTLVALEALSAWSSLQPSPSNLTVTARSGTVSKVAKLDPVIRIPEVLKMGTGDQISIRVEGSGCALVQATRGYRAPSLARSQHQLGVQLAVLTDGTFDCDGANCFCAAVIQACAVWSGSFPEMALMEVSLPGGFGVDAARLYSQLHEPDTLLRRVEVSASSSRAALYLAPRDGTGPRRGHACFLIHAVGPRARTAPAYVRLLDYYSPSVNDTQIYTIPEECPSRVSHEASQDMTSDNLYNIARSMSDKDEILITHEFSFEDIPEGIPLEDPLYDNLTRKVKDKSDLRKKNYTSNSNSTNIRSNTKIHFNTNNGDSPNYSDKANYSDNTNKYNSTNHSKNTNFNDSVKNSDFYNPIYTNPYIPLSNQNKPVRNNLSKVSSLLESNENKQQKDRDQTDNIIDLKNKIKTNHSDRSLPRARANGVFSSFFSSENTKLDQINADVGRGKLHGTETTTIHNNTAATTHSNYENQKSITLDTATKSNSNNINNYTNSDNEINRQTMPNHIIEIRDDHKDNPPVDNPVLSDFHVIDSEKDLDVPSGLEGPVPVAVLPPMNFVPPKQFSLPATFVPSTPDIRKNFDPRIGVRNNDFTPRNRDHLSNNKAQPNSVSNRFAQYNSAVNSFAANNFESQSAITNFAPKKSASINFPPNIALSNFAPQDFTPNSFVRPNTPNSFVRQIKPNNFDAFARFPLQNSVPDNYTPNNFATQYAPINPASQNTPNIFYPQNAPYLAQNYAAQNFAAKQPHRDVVPPPLPNEALSDGL